MHAMSVLPYGERVAPRTVGEVVIVTFFVDDVAMAPTAPCVARARSASIHDDVFLVYRLCTRGWSHGGERRTGGLTGSKDFAISFYLTLSH